MRSLKPIIIFSLIMSGLLLSACGQKGPLFIPEDELAEIQAKQMEKAMEAQAANMKEAAAETGSVEAPDTVPAGTPDKASGGEVEVIDESPKQDKDSAEKKKVPTAE